MKVINTASSSSPSPSPITIASKCQAFGARESVPARQVRTGYGESSHRPK